METDPDKLRDFAARYTEAWCSQDPARVAAFFSTEGSLTVNGGAPAVGRSAIAALAQSFMTDFPDLRVTMDDLVMRDGRAEYHWTLSGTNSGPRGTGRKVRISGVEKWRLGSDGLIRESEGNFDAAEYRRQIQEGI